MRIEIAARHLLNVPRSPLGVLFLVLGMASGQAPPADFLSRTVPRDLSVAEQSPVYAAHDVLLWAKLAGGVVYLGGDGQAADVFIPEGTIVSDALNRVLGGQNKYIWREIDGVLDILPQKDQPPLLSANIPFFEWRSSESPGGVVGRLQQLPEVLRRMSQLGYVDGLHYGGGLQKQPRVGAPPPPTEDPQVFVRRNIALLDLLNEIVKSYSRAAIWWYNEVAQGQVRAVTISAR